MAEKNRSRTRSRCINFHVTQDEYDRIQARITVCGMPKGEYFIKSLLHQKVLISAGKFQSDRLSIEIKKLRFRLDETDRTETVNKCINLLEQLLEITESNRNLSEPGFEGKCICNDEFPKEGEVNWTKK